MKEIIRKVYPNRRSNQKLVSIPKGSKIKIGDYVYIWKVGWPKPRFSKIISDIKEIKK